MKKKPALTLERFGQLVAISLLYLLVWNVAGLYATSEFYRRALAGGTADVEWMDTFVLQLVTAFNWAFFTPIVVTIAEKFPLRKPQLARNAAIMLAVVPLISFLRAVEGGIVLRLGEREPVTLAFIKLSLEIRFHRYYYLTAIIIGVTNLFLIKRDAVSRARAAFAAEALLARNEMQELRANLQPEFLFRTLERSKSLLRRNRDAADRLIVGLSDLLRRRLAFGSDNIPVEEELEFLDRYVSLNGESSDTAQALYVDVDDDLLSRRVPALLLQPLIEHAVAHMNGDGFVNVSGSESDSMLHFQVRYEGDADVEWDGLARMRLRLQKMFGDKQSLVLRREGRVVIAEVAVPAELPEGPARKSSGRYRAVAL